VDKGFVILEHPADLGIEARGVSLAGAFEEAARGLMSVVLELGSVDAREEREVSVSSADYEQLLVKWLSEVLYLYDGNRFVCREFHIDRIAPTGLHATVHGEPLDPAKHRTLLDVKAVTYHQLSIQENKDGAVVRVFLDI